MSFKKRIKYDNSQLETILVRYEASTGFVPFQITKTGVNTGDIFANGDLEVSGNTVLTGTLAVESNTDFNGAVFTSSVLNSTFSGTVNFTGTTTFATVPSNFVPSTRTVTANEGLTGGGDLSANRTIGIAANGVTTAKIADSNITTAKIADTNITTAKIADLNVTAAKIANNAVTYNKVDGGDIMRINQVDTPVGYEIARMVQGAVNIPTFPGGGTLNFSLAPYLGLQLQSAFDIVSVYVTVRQSGSNFKYPLDYTGNGAPAVTAGGSYTIVGSPTNQIQITFNTGGAFDSASFNNATVEVTFIYIVQV